MEVNPHSFHSAKVCPAPMVCKTLFLVQEERRKEGCHTSEVGHDDRTVCPLQKPTRGRGDTEKQTEKTRSSLGETVREHSQEVIPWLHDSRTEASGESEGRPWKHLEAPCSIQGTASMKNPSAVSRAGYPELQEKVTGDTGKKVTQGLRRWQVNKEWRLQF